MMSYSFKLVKLYLDIFWSKFDKFANGAIDAVKNFKSGDGTRVDKIDSFELILMGWKY